MALQETEREIDYDEIYDRLGGRRGPAGRWTGTA